MSAMTPPPGYHTLTAYLSVKNAAAAIDFYVRAFGAELAMKLTAPDGSVVHAELRIGDSIFMLSDENLEWGNRSAASLGGSPVSLLVYVPEVDQAFSRALAAGALAVHPLQDQFYGDRSGSVRDPEGYLWTLATHFEDVSEAEGQRRLDEWLKQGGAG